MKRRCILYRQVYSFASILDHWSVIRMQQLKVLPRASSETFLLRRRSSYSRSSRKGGLESIGSFHRRHSTQRVSTCFSLQATPVQTYFRTDRRWYEWETKPQKLTYA